VIGSGAKSSVSGMRNASSPCGHSYQFVDGLQDHHTIIPDLVMMVIKFLNLMAPHEIGLTDRAQGATGRSSKTLFGNRSVSSQITCHILRGLVTPKSRWPRLAGELIIMAVCIYKIYGR
jgi:hypothetical protein